LTLWKREEVVLNVEIVVDVPAVVELRVSTLHEIYGVRPSLPFSIITKYFFVEW
jgi:hypothetical protein